MQTGMVWVNGRDLSLGDAPLGGYKHSGIGREGDWGAADIAAYTETQILKLSNIQMIYVLFQKDCFVNANKAPIYVAFQSQPETRHSYSH